MWPAEHWSDRLKTNSPLVQCCFFLLVFTFCPSHVIIISCVSALVTLHRDTCGAPVLTGKGSAPSWITKPSIRWVRMWDLTKAWAGLLSPLCWLLLVFPLPEVMTGAMTAPLLTCQHKQAWQTQQAPVTWTWLPNSCCSNTQRMQKVIWPWRLDVGQSLAALRTLIVFPQEAILNLPLKQHFALFQQFSLSL